MILKCKVCNKEFMGARAKQSIRGHLINAHGIKVSKVMECDQIEEVKPEIGYGEIVEESHGRAEIDLKSETNSLKTDNWQMITDILKTDIPTKLRQQLRYYQQQGAVVYNALTNEVGFDE